jgi:hypothetical protein
VHLFPTHPAALADPPRVEPMSRLLDSFPHLGMDTACTHAVNKLAAAALVSAMASPTAKRRKPSAENKEEEEEEEEKAGVSRERLHFENSQENPVALQILMRCRAQVMKPEYRLNTLMPVPEEHFDLLLRSGQASLPVFGFKHESRMLIQSGPVQLGAQTYTLPPCVRDKACVGWTARDRILGLTEPIVLMRALTPKQWDDLGRHGKMPHDQGPCVLCHRKTLSAYVHNARFLATSPGDSGGLQLVAERPMQVGQLWRNPMDCPDGYASVYAIKERPNELVVEKLCDFNYWSLTASKLHGRWVLSQEPLRWRPCIPTQPLIGEELGNF